MIGAKPLGLFILFSLTAEQDLRKGKIEGGARGAKTICKFLKCSETQRPDFPCEGLSSARGADTHPHTQTPLLPQGLSRVRGEWGTHHSECSGLCPHLQVQKGCHFIGP